MSGGTFDYDQYRLEEIQREIRRIINNNNIEDEYGFATKYSQETINKLEKAIDILREAYIYTQRIDYLYAADDGEETFHKRLNEDLKSYKTEFYDEEK